jgi:hypothetical protein
LNEIGLGVFSVPEPDLIPRGPVRGQNDELLAPNPGEAVETVNGITRQINVEVVDSARVRVRSDELELSIQTSNTDGQNIGVSPDNRVFRLQEGGWIRFVGSCNDPVKTCSGVNFLST